MNQLLKKFIPPILIDLLRPARKTPLRKLYRSYEEASKDLRESGVNNVDTSEIVLKKTRKFINDINNQPFMSVDLLMASQVISLLMIDNKSVKVLDFGGACGNHYFMCKRVLGDRVGLNWNVVETENMCAYGKTLSNDELNFFSDLNVAARQLGGIDLILSSGTLQYLPDPRSILSQMIKLDPTYILLTRLSLSQQDKDIIVIQNYMLSEMGIGDLPEGFTNSKMSDIHTSISETDFLKIMARHYDIVLKFKEESGIHQVNDELITGFGVLYKRKELST